MADNTQLPISTTNGDVIAADDIGGVKYQRVKLIKGADGVNDGDISDTNPLPVSDATIDGHFKTYDSAHSGSDKGLVVLGDKDGVLDTFKMDASGNLLTALPTGAATEATLQKVAGVVYSHNAAFIDGSAGLLILGKRRDSDSTEVADGDLNAFNMDEEGRLKVASKPASYPDITGDITAIQATIGTPVVGGTVAGDVSRASNLMLFCTGTFSTVNCTFEGSLESTGDTNWFGVQAVRSNANTIETATGNLSAQPVYAWEASVNALKRFRVRCTARTSGTQSWRFVQGTYATEPIPAAQVTATQPVSGTVTATLASPTVYTDTTTNLGSNATYTGTSRDAGATPAFHSFVGRAFADQAGTFRIEQSTDNTNWRRATADTAVVANTPVTLEAIVCARYYRVVFVNGAVAQGTFQVTSAYHRV